MPEVRAIVKEQYLTVMLDQNAAVAALPALLAEPGEPAELARIQDATDGDGKVRAKAVGVNRR